MFVSTMNISHQTASLTILVGFLPHKADMIPGVYFASNRLLKKKFSSTFSTPSIQADYWKCEVDSSSSDDVVILYWIMTDTHVVPDRQQQDEHKH